MRASLTLCGLIVLGLILAACSTQVQRTDAELQPAMPRYENPFWPPVAEADERDWLYPLSASEEALSWRLRMIDSARHQIDMETFLWKSDEAGKAILAHLVAAADRGVKVRMLLDDSTTAHQDRVLSRIEHHPNIQLRIYNPYAHRSGGFLSRALFNLDDFQRVNHRLHNKILIVDGWALNVGGRNLANEYFGLDPEFNFRDMEVIVLGASVANASAHFSAFWNSVWSVPVGQLIEMRADDTALESLRSTLAPVFETSPVADEAELQAQWRQLASLVVPGRVTFVADAPAAAEPAADATRLLGRELLKIIDDADEEVVLVAAYLVPTDELSQAIADATGRGVTVRILTNSLRSNNHLSAHAAYAGYIRGLLDAGVELFEMRADARDKALYMRTPVADKKLGLHAKFLLVDSDRSFIGSSNLDPRSLVLNTEVGLLIESEALNTHLRDAIAVDFDLANAWRVELTREGSLLWRGSDQSSHRPPADSDVQLLEDWFIGLLPIDANM